MKNIARIAALSLAMGTLVSVPAWAADCPPLKLFNSIPMSTGTAGLRMLVPVTVNGMPEKMLLDTGTSRTMLGQEAVNMLKLQQDDTHKKMLDAKGNASQSYATVEDFGLGAMHGKSMTFFIAPDPALGQGQPFIGVLGPDLMSAYDVEMDFAGLKLNFFSKDHCDGKVVYWPAPVVGIMPFDKDSEHIRFKVMLDGKTLTATLNTGSQRTTMYSEAARRVMGVTSDTPGVVPLGGPDKVPEHQSFGKIFSSLSFAGVTVNNPHVVVVPNLIGTKDANNTVMTGSHIIREDDVDVSDMTIGMDVLKHLHLYIAYGERNLYVTPGDATATPAAPASQ